MLADHLTRTLTDLGNHLLRLDPDSARRLAPLVGKIARIESLTPPFTLFIAGEAEGLIISAQCERAPDVIVRARSGAFLRLAFARGQLDPNALREVAIEGDVELGQRFLALFAQLDIDWEEQASRVIGDTAAHQVGNVVRGLSAWAAQAARTLARDAGEFFQHEQRVTPPRAEVERFLNDVDVLRADVDRIEQRLRRLWGDTP